MILPLSKISSYVMYNSVLFRAIWKQAWCDPQSVDPKIATDLAWFTKSNVVKAIYTSTWCLGYTRIIELL